MAKLSYKISYYILYAMFAVILVVIGLFFFGGDAQGDAVVMGVDPEMWQPAYTDALLYLTYALFAIVSVAAVVSFFHFLVTRKLLWVLSMCWLVHSLFSALHGVWVAPKSWKSLAMVVQIT